MKGHIMNKKLVITSSLAILLVAGGTHLAINEASATETPPIVQEVQNHKEQLDNHEARITNAENNIKDLQNNTNTSPSSNNVAVPTVKTQPAASEQLTTNPSAPEPIPTQIPPNVSMVKEGPTYVTASVFDKDKCILFYSDGTQGSKPATKNDCNQYLSQPK
jgi:hypothetical protein